MENAMNDIRNWIAFALFAAITAGTAVAQNTPDASTSLMVPLPVPVPAKEALATLPDTRLWYWDTGGDGIPVVLGGAQPKPARPSGGGVLRNALSAEKPILVEVAVT
jgi:hypothetical protein